MAACRGCAVGRWGGADADGAVASGARYAMGDDDDRRSGAWAVADVRPAAVEPLGARANDKSRSVRRHSTATRPPRGVRVAAPRGVGRVPQQASQMPPRNVRGA